MAQAIRLMNLYDAGGGREGGNDGGREAERERSVLWTVDIHVHVAIPVNVPLEVSGSYIHQGHWPVETEGTRLDLGGGLSLAVIESCPCC